MENNLNNYISVIKSIWNESTDSPKIPIDNDLILLKLKKIIDLFSIGNSFFYIVNLHNGYIESVSPSIENILGIKDSDFDLNTYLQIIHPEDLHHLIEIQKSVSSFTVKNRSNERLQYKFCYDFRIKHKNGEYKQLYIQHFYLGLSENYNPQRAFSFLTDISHIKIGGVPKLNIFKLGDGIVDILNDKNEQKIQLTNKENEIFEYLIKGFTSRDIANALEISKHTVDTHRRNILKRNNCYNTSELLSLYFETKIESL